MKRKIATIRDGAGQRLQIGVIGALGTVIGLFLLLGNISIKPAKITPGRSDSLIYPGLPIDPVKLTPPPATKKVVQFDVAKPGDKTTDSLPAPNLPDSFILPGRDLITRTLDSIGFIPPDAKYPKMIGDLDVKYPDVLRAHGVEGVAAVLFGLDREGRVFAARVYKSSGYAQMDSAAVDAIRKARFTPAMQGDKPIEVKMAMEIEFRLD